MLPTGAARTVSVDPKILFLNLDLDLVFDVRAHVNRCERGVPPGGSIEWRNPDESVDTGFGLEKAVGVLSFHQEGGGLDPCLLPLLVL